MWHVSSADLYFVTNIVTFVNMLQRRAVLQDCKCIET